MKTLKIFNPADRYIFDFDICSVKNGFAQVDTSQDAAYFGTWANPETLIIINYAEGDVTKQTADNELEFVKELQELKLWNIENEYRFGIDTMCNDALTERFTKLGLAELLH